MRPNSALFRLFTQSDGQCRAICEDTPDCRWVSGQQHIMCSDQCPVTRVKVTAALQIISTQRDIFSGHSFTDFTTGILSTTVPAPCTATCFEGQCSQISRSLTTSLSVHNVLASKEGGDPGIDRNHNTRTFIPPYIFR